MNAPSHEPQILRHNACGTGRATQVGYQIQGITLLLVLFSSSTWAQKPWALSRAEQIKIAATTQAATIKKPLLTLTFGIKNGIRYPKKSRRQINKLVKTLNRDKSVAFITLMGEFGAKGSTPEKKRKATSRAKRIHKMLIKAGLNTQKIKTEILAAPKKNSNKNPNHRVDIFLGTLQKKPNKPVTPQADLTTRPQKADGSLPSATATTITPNEPAPNPKQKPNKTEKSPKPQAPNKLAQKEETSIKSENVKSLKNVKAHSTNKPDQAPPPMHNLEVPSKKVSDKESGKAPDGPVEKRPEVAPKVFSGEGLEQAWDENPKEGLDVASNLLSERDSEDAWHQDSEEAWDETPTQDPQEAPQEQWAGQPAIAWVVGGVGTAFLGGVVTTFFIRSNLNLDNAPDSSDPKKDDLHNRYDSLTNLMWGLGVAGILTAGWAAYEIFSVPPEKTTQSAAQVRVTMLPSRGFAMSIEGRF